MYKPKSPILGPRGLTFTVWGGPRGNRTPADVEIVKRNKKTIWVRLPDGNIVKRKNGRDY